MKQTIPIISLILLSLSLTGQPIEGEWNMVGMKSGKLRSTIEIYKEGGKYYGKVIKIYPASSGGEDAVCEKCSDEREGEPVLGMNIIRDLEYDASRKEYVNGKILDPISGSEYSCKAWIDHRGRLVIKGYVLFFNKTYILPKNNLWNEF